MPDKTAPSAIDIHVGERLRRLRSLKNITQQGLGEALGISFQQVQKYEKGTNRISASKMFEIMQLFGTNADYFFNGLNDGMRQTGFAEPHMPEYTLEQPATDTTELLEAFQAITNPALKRRIVDLVKTMAEEDGTPPRIS